MAVEVQALDVETLRSLLEQAQKTEAESKYILELSEWARQGPAYTDYQKFRIVLGDADVIEKRCWDEGYPYRRGCDYLILPKTIPVIVEVESRDDTGDQEHYELGYWIFTAEGWKYVRVK